MPLVQRISINVGERVDLVAQERARMDLPIIYGDDDLSSGYTAKFVVRKYADVESSLVKEWTSNDDPSSLTLGSAGAIEFTGLVDFRIGPYAYALTLGPTGADPDVICWGAFIVEPNVAGA